MRYIIIISCSLIFFQIIHAKWTEGDKDELCLLVSMINTDTTPEKLDLFENSTKETFLNLTYNTKNGVDESREDLEDLIFYMHLCKEVANRVELAIDTYSSKWSGGNKEAVAFEELKRKHAKSGVLHPKIMLLPLEKSEKIDSSVIADQNDRALFNSTREKYLNAMTARNKVMNLQNYYKKWQDYADGCYEILPKYVQQFSFKYYEDEFRKRMSRLSNVTNTNKSTNINLKSDAINSILADKNLSIEQITIRRESINSNKKIEPINEQPSTARKLWWPWLGLGTLIITVGWLFFRKA